MIDKITPLHLQKTAFVYIRQSSLGQVRHHRESTERQYALQDTAVRWAGCRVESKYSTVTWGDLVRQRLIAPTAERSSPMCRWEVPELSWRWKRRALRDPTRTGTD